MTIVSPLILDTGIIMTVTSNNLQHIRLKHLSKWGMTTLGAFLRLRTVHFWLTKPRASAELCDVLGDGIRKLREGPVWQYIPNFDWPAVRTSIGPSPMYSALIVERDEGKEDAKPMAHDRSLRTIVCDVLSIDARDMLAEMPLTAYGLDSLSASSLALALRPVLEVTQIQLLANMTLGDLEARIGGGSSG